MRMLCICTHCLAHRLSPDLNLVPNCYPANSCGTTGNSENRVHVPSIVPTWRISCFISIVCTCHLWCADLLSICPPIQSCQMCHHASYITVPEYLPCVYCSRNLVCVTCHNVFSRCTACTRAWYCMSSKWSKPRTMPNDLAAQCSCFVPISKLSSHVRLLHLCTLPRQRRSIESCAANHTDAVHVRRRRRLSQHTIVLWHHPCQQQSLSSQFQTLLFYAHCLHAVAALHGSCLQCAQALYLDNFLPYSCRPSGLPMLPIPLHLSQMLSCCHPNFNMSPSLWQVSESHHTKSTVHCSVRANRLPCPWIPVTFQCPLCLSSFPLLHYQMCQYTLHSVQATVAFFSSPWE